MIHERSTTVKAWPFLLLALTYGLFVGSGIRNIDFQYWDEPLYVNAARAYLTTSKPYPIPDHPPLGKEIIAAGIYLFGDNPVGWRFFSVAAGAVSVGLIALIIFLLTQRLWAGLFVGALVFLDPLLFVNFRIGLLDPPLTALLLISTLLALIFLTSPRMRWSLLPLLGLSLGLATATKMLTIVFFPILGGAVLYRILRSVPKPLAAMAGAVLTVGTLAVAAFCATYWILGYSLQETWDLVRYIFAWHRVASAQSQLISPWWEWLYIGNPIFYFYRRLGPNQWWTIIATGNLVLWVAAELAAFYALIRFYRRPEIWMIALPVVLQFLMYTQKRSTFIHYMTEILPFLYILLGVTLADLWERYGSKYRRVLQIDFALLAAGAALLFFNYWPFIWGKPVTTAQFKKVSGAQMAFSRLPPDDSASASLPPLPEALP